MSWYRFDWTIFANDALLDRLLAAIGVANPTDEDHAALRPWLANVLAAVGGPGVAPRVVPAAQRASIGAELLEWAIGRVLAPARVRTVPGVAIGEGDGAVPIAAVDRVPLNYASATAIGALPGIGRTRAQRIVAERQRRPFRGLRDLVERVDGMTDALASSLATVVTFELPRLASQVVPSGSLDSDWHEVVEAQPDAGVIERAVRALETTLAVVRASPPPLSRFEHDPMPEAPPAEYAADEVTALFGSAYYTRVANMIGAATHHVDVCMFHIALPERGHPTRRLLDALIRARDNGAAVRVLVDRDRPEDPYLSSVINAAAIAYLAEGGVAVRSDLPEQLLHSKFVLIDDDLALIGSHNWTAGSYFRFDDLTLAIRSAPLVRAQRRRFGGLWSAAQG